VGGHCFAMSPGGLLRGYGGDGRMGISATGSRSLTMAAVTRLMVTGLVVLGALFYLYGPATVPLLHAAAVSRCNDHAGGSFRTYRLGWVVGTHPHWTCWDTRRPTVAPVDLGWWVGR
jgi:hypothetical protein